MNRLLAYFAAMIAFICDSDQPVHRHRQEPRERVARIDRSKTKAARKQKHRSKK